jgi:hypothetical protein
MTWSALRNSRTDLRTTSPEVSGAISDAGAKKDYFLVRSLLIGGGLLLVAAIVGVIFFLLS